MTQKNIHHLRKRLVNILMRAFTAKRSSMILKKSKKDRAGNPIVKEKEKPETVVPDGAEFTKKKKTVISKKENAESKSVKKRKKALKKTEK